VVTLGWVEMLILCGVFVAWLVPPFVIEARVRRVAREVWSSEARGWSRPVSDETRRAVAAAASSLNLTGQPVWRHGGFRTCSEATAWWSRYRAITPAADVRRLLAIVAEEGPEPGVVTPARSLARRSAL